LYTFGFVVWQIFCPSSTKTVEHFKSQDIASWHFEAAELETLNTGIPDSFTEQMQRASESRHRRATLHPNLGQWQW
jgi:hypothetical protein